MRRSIHYFDRFKHVLKRLDLGALARQTGFQRRRPRKLSPRCFVWATVLGAMHLPARGLADVARAAGTFGARGLTRQGLHRRLTDRAAAFLRAVADRLGAALTDLAPPALPGPLAGFTDVTAVDTTLVGLVDRLVREFPACRTNSRLAAAKLHARVSLTHREAEALALTSERVPDLRGTDFGPWVRGRLVLFDLGYFDYRLFARIVQDQGAFLTRLQATANGTILAVRQGTTRASEGHGLNDVRFEGESVDLDVAYGRGAHTVALRTVGLWNATTRAYHWYVTSLAPDAWSPAGLGPLYALRWQVELVFKSWKSFCHLTDQPSARAAVVEVLLLASVCFALLARIVLVLASAHHRLAWHRLSPTLALKLLLGYAFMLGVVLARGGHRARDVLRSLVDTLAVYAYCPNGTNTLCTFMD